MWLFITEFQTFSAWQYWICLDQFIRVEHQHSKMSPKSKVWRQFQVTNIAEVKWRHQNCNCLSMRTITFEGFDSLRGVLIKISKFIWRNFELAETCINTRYWIESVKLQSLLRVLLKVEQNYSPAYFTKVPILKLVLLT